MEEEKKNQAAGLGVGALVAGIIAFLLAVVPCLGMIAIIPAIVAIVLAIVGLSRSNNNQGILIGGLVIAIIALMISISQSFIIGRIAHKSENWAGDIEKAVKEIGADIEKEFGDKEFTIRVENDDETIEINASAKRDVLKDKLDELEGVPDTTVTAPDK